MNYDAKIMRDPYKKCDYFLSLIKGPNIEGWLMTQDKWLDRVCEDPSVLPWQMNEWEVMEQEFKKAFVDYAAQERASEELSKLKMKDGNVDQYIARFRQLALLGGHNIDQPSVINLFALGMPNALTDACLDLHDPENFEEWCHTAQKNH